MRRTKLKRLKRYFRASLSGAGAGLFAGIASIGFMGDVAFVFLVSVVPATLFCLCLARLAPRLRNRPFLHHAVACMAGYFAVVLAGSLGAPAAQAYRFGYERTNVSGYFRWSWIYAAIFLPVSYPVAYIASEIPRRRNDD